MNRDLFVLLAANFTLIGLLPRLTFRRDGRFHLAWYATASPLLLAAGAVVAVQVGVLTPVSRAQLGQPGDVIAVVASALSIALMAATVGVHRIPLALWHQENDAPRQIVSWGPYSLVRHPFYVSFILALAAAFVAAPHAVTASTLVAGVVALTFTARREERRLLTSELGTEYGDYLSVTGRFLPKLQRRPA